MSLSNSHSLFDLWKCKLQEHNLQTHLLLAHLGIPKFIVQDFSLSILQSTPKKIKGLPLSHIESFWCLLVRLLGFLQSHPFTRHNVDFLQDLETLVKTPSQFEAVPDIAFGLVQMTPETQHSAYAGRFGLPLPELTQILKGVSASRHLQPNEKSMPFNLSVIALISLDKVSSCKMSDTSNINYCGKTLLKPILLKV